MEFFFFCAGSAVAMLATGDLSVRLINNSSFLRETVLGLNISENS